LTSKAEYYDIASNVWKNLTDLPEAFISPGLCEFYTASKAYLYSFGGLQRGLKNDVTLLSQIYRLDLSNLDEGWKVLPISLPTACCDSGVL